MRATSFEAHGRNAHAWHLAEPPLFAVARGWGEASMSGLDALEAAYGQGRAPPGEALLHAVMAMHERLMRDDEGDPVTDFVVRVWAHVTAFTLDGDAATLVWTGKCPLWLARGGALTRLTEATEAWLGRHYETPLLRSRTVGLRAGDRLVALSEPFCTEEELAQTLASAPPHEVPVRLVQRAKFPSEPAAVLVQLDA